uniref:Rubisco LSMT substrate-binding domain-containing protein n=1 Tax=Corethron hystrix TaxID=216773 RepID=A0A7S1BS18_9STRA|mmetsp:Transcript_37277/g.86949  ORF Transcript_37277/g.86949 Transcript_37277/m.86949 type:complete len:897 (+) Transcript_37277:261-2951(+)
MKNGKKKSKSTPQPSSSSQPATSANKHSEETATDALGTFPPLSLTAEEEALILTYRDVISKGPALTDDVADDDHDGDWTTVARSRSGSGSEEFKTATVKEKEKVKSDGSTKASPASPVPSVPSVTPSSPLVEKVADKSIEDDAADTSVKTTASPTATTTETTSATVTKRKKKGGGKKVVDKNKQIDSSSSESATSAPITTNMVPPPKFSASKVTASSTKTKKKTRGAVDNNGKKRRGGNSSSKDVDAIFLASIPPPKSSSTLSLLGAGILGGIIAVLAVRFISISELSTTLFSSQPVSTSSLVGTKSFLSKFICKTKGGSCHPSLVAVSERRTHVVSDTIGSGETLLELPRQRLITDLDALRDSFIRRELWGATHISSGRFVDSGAYLAAHLSIRIAKLNSGGWTAAKDVMPPRAPLYNNADSIHGPEDVMGPFLSILPTYSKLRVSHPSLWSPADVNKYLSGTVASSLSSSYRTMMLSEYTAFSSLSSSFRLNVSLESYLAARVNVLSRSFGIGPASSSLRPRVPSEEMAKYRSIDIDLDLGLRALSPILDMWDHHAGAPTVWNYERSRQAFIVKVKKGETIPKGHDVMVSYGSYSDSHLLVKFGFVNGDGSGWTEASIAVHHSPERYTLHPQYILDDERESDPTSLRLAMATYLQYDMGYPECLSPNDGGGGAWSFKALKHDILLASADVRDKWVMRLSPRAPDDRPATSSSVPLARDTPPKFPPKEVNFDGRKLISTCRLIALLPEDYDGQARQILMESLRNGTAPTLTLQKHGEELEARALACLANLAEKALSAYSSTVKSDMELLDAMDNGGTDKRSFFHSPAWTSAHVRMGEMQSLEVLKNIGKSGVTTMLKRLKKKGEDPDSVVVRKTPCPWSSTLELVKDQYVPKRKK